MLVLTNMVVDRLLYPIYHILTKNRQTPLVGQSVCFIVPNMFRMAFDPPELGTYAYGTLVRAPQRSKMVPRMSPLSCTNRPPRIGNNGHREATSLLGMLRPIQGMDHCRHFTRIIGMKIAPHIIRAPRVQHDRAKPISQHVPSSDRYPTPPRSSVIKGPIRVDTDRTRI